MKNILADLSKIAGTYEGEGINHEAQLFFGQLNLQPILDGRGVSLQFCAIGKDGTVYHKEESTIAPNLNDKLVLWNLNTNMPGLVAHELKTSSSKNGTVRSFVFGFNDITDKNSFREEIALEMWANGDISYTYSWGMPGGEFKERSGVRMTRVVSTTRQPEWLIAGAPL